MQTTTTKPHDLALIERVNAVIASDGVRQTDIARTIGLSDGVLSPWLRGKYSGDVENVEGLLTEWLNARAANARIVTGATFATPVTEAVIAEIETAACTGACALITGDAGAGKTTAIAQYAAAHPRAIVVTLTKFNAHKEGILGAVMDYFGAKEWQRSGKTRGVFLGEKLRGTGRALIFDNAQRLGGAALDMLLDIHDATPAADGTGKAALVLVGNDSIRAVVGAVAQRESRVDADAVIHFRAPGAGNEARDRELRDACEAAAQRVARAICPEVAGAPGVARLIAAIARERRNLRSVERRVRRAAYVLGRAKCAPERALRAANAASLDPVALPASAVDTTPLPPELLRLAAAETK